MPSYNPLGRFRVQYGPFGITERAVWDSKTARFAS